MSATTDQMKRTQHAVPASVVCEGKRKFATARLAQQVARAGNRRNDRNYSAYRCGTCLFWHTGTAPKGHVRNQVAKRHKQRLREIREGESEC